MPSISKMDVELITKINNILVKYLNNLQGSIKIIMMNIYINKKIHFNIKYKRKNRQMIFAN